MIKRDPWTHKIKHQRIWLRHTDKLQPDDRWDNFIGSDGQFHSFYKESDKIIKLKKRRL